MCIRDRVKMTWGRCLCSCSFLGLQCPARKAFFMSALLISHDLRYLFTLQHLQQIPPTAERLRYLLEPLSLILYIHFLFFYFRQQTTFDELLSALSSLCWCAVKKLLTHSLKQSLWLSSSPLHICSHSIAGRCTITSSASVYTSSATLLAGGM